MLPCSLARDLCTQAVERFWLEHSVVLTALPEFLHLVQVHACHFASAAEMYLLASHPAWSADVLYVVPCRTRTHRR